MPRPRLTSCIVAASAAAALTVTGCSHSQPRAASVAAPTNPSSGRPQTPPADPTDGQVTYMVADATTVVLVRWTRSGDYLNGTVDVSTKGQDVRGQHLMLTGTQKGDNVSLTVGTAQWTGTIDAGTLTVHLPAADGSLQELALTPASIADYNTAISGLHDAANAEASATKAANERAGAEAAVADADAELTRDLESVTSAAATVRDSAVFTDELASMGDTLDTLRADLATTIADSKSDCSMAGGDAGTVEGDLGTLEGDRQTLEGGIQTLDAALSTMRQALDDARASWDKLQAARTAAPGADASNDANTVAAAVAKSDYASQVAKKATASARAKAKALMTTGAQLRDQANAAANRCS